MALGLKGNETRGWETSYRGDLAICSAKRKMTRDEGETFEILVQPDAPPAYRVVYGCVLCVVELYDCVPTEAFHGPSPRVISDCEAYLGNYALGRFAWLTRNLRRLKTPVPVVGQRGLWVLPPDVTAQVTANLPEHVIPTLVA